MLLGSIITVIMAHQHGQPAGICPLNHLHFHGLSWRSSNLKERGQPLVLIFDHNRDYPIDKIWVVKLAKSFLRKQGNRIVFSEKNMAFQTYKKDMAFNAPGTVLLTDREPLDEMNGQILSDSLNPDSDREPLSIQSTRLCKVAT
jgi:hypothetical protein